MLDLGSHQIYIMTRPDMRRAQAAKALVMAAH